MDLNKIYEKEKLINSYFRKKYNYNSEEIFNKQILELHCELSEFAYETKCFKYWKNENPSNSSITIPEFADCLMITLSFCDLANIKKLIIIKNDSTDIVKLFIETHKLISKLSYNTNCNLNKDILFKILSNLITISALLNYTDEELFSICINKMNKTLEMIQKK